ncbi:hypothetical protein HYY74_01240 [Candidatus Woesearchaeota archaeon]|nr:hypothetical protein [Candidatus Woesearchaeota archaeon]
MVHAKERGQAAMEFLMTYGWAILVVLVVIGALAYFGVLSPDTLLPEKCTFPVQIGCKDYKVTNAGAADSIIVSLQNGAGRDMIVRKVNATSEAVAAGTLAGGGCSTAISAAPVTVRNGDAQTFTMNKDNTEVATTSCVLIDTGRSKNRYRVQILYSWIDSQAVTHTIDGELLVKTEQG